VHKSRSGAENSIFVTERAGGWFKVVTGSF